MTLLWTVTYFSRQQYYVDPIPFTRNPPNGSILRSKYGIMNYYNRLKCHIQLETFSSEQQLLKEIQQLIIPEHSNYFAMLSTIQRETSEFYAVEFWLSYDMCVQRIAGEFEEDHEETKIFRVQFTRFVTCLEELVSEDGAIDPEGYGGELSPNSSFSKIVGSKNVKKVLKYWLAHFQLIFRQFPDHDYLTLLVNLLCQKFPSLIKLFEVQVEGVFVELNDVGEIDKLHIPGFTNVLDVTRQLMVCVLKNIKYLMLQGDSKQIDDDTFEESFGDMSLDGLVHSTPNTSFSSEAGTPRICSFCGGDNHTNRACGILKHFFRFKILRESFDKNELIIKDFNGDPVNFSTVPNVQCPEFHAYIKTLGLD